jgi:DNA polymerase-3 subunit beta
MPILGYILLQTSRDRIHMTATDLELAIQAEVEADVKQGGQATVPARLLLEIVGQLPSSTVELRAEEGSPQCRITCEASEFEILGLPPSDFPVLPRLEGDPVAVVDADTLRTMVAQTIFAVSTDETRPFLTGVYVVFDGEEGRFVATDGGRLALRKTVLGRSVRQKLAAIIPAKALQELARALAGVDAGVQVAVADTQVVFSVPGLRVFSRVISGQFPNYEKVIPDAQAIKQRIRVKTERFLRAVRRAAITARDSANVVRLAARGTTLTLTSNTPEVGRAREEVEVTVEGEVVEAAFNARYLLDCLNTIEADEVVLELTGPLSPGVIRPAHHGEYVYVLAPVRVYG